VAGRVFKRVAGASAVHCLFWMVSTALSLVQLIVLRFTGHQAHVRHALLHNMNAVQHTTCLV
jgi:hypothetical protein